MGIAILIVEIAMVVAGIFALIRGEIALTKVHYVDGWSSRIAGCILILQLPLSFAVGFIIGLVRAAHGETLQPNEAPFFTLYVDLPILSICGFLAVGICMGSVAADAYRGKTYLSDTEGPLGSWNAPVAGGTKPESTAIAAGRPSVPRPRRKKKRSRARRPSANSGMGARLVVIAVFLALGLLVSGGTIWWVHRQIENASQVAEDKPAKTVPVAQNIQWAPPVVADQAKNPAPVVPKPGPAVPAGTGMPRPSADKKAAAKPPPVLKPEKPGQPNRKPASGQRSAFGDEVAETIALERGNFQAQGHFEDTDPFDRNTQNPARLYLVKLEAGQAYFAEMKRVDGGGVIPCLRLEEVAGLEMASDRNPRSLGAARFLYLAPKTAAYRLIAATIGGGAGNFTLSLRQVQEGDPLPELPPPPLPVPPQALQVARTLEPYLAAAIAPNCRVAWVTYPSGKLERFSCPDFTVLETYQLPRKIYQLALDGRGILYAVAQLDQEKSGPGPDLGVADLQLYNTRALPAPGKTHVPTKVIRLHGIVQHLLVSPDDASLYYLDTHNRKVGRIDLKTAKVERENSQLEAGTNALCLTPNGKALYTCSSTNVVQQLDPATLEVRKTFKIDRGSPNGIQATDSGYVFLKSGEDRSTHVYLLNTNLADKGAAVAVFPWASVYRPRSIRLSPDQKCLYTAYFDAAPARIISFYVGERPGLFRGQQYGSVILEPFHGRGQMEVSRDGGFLFCDRGVIVLLGH